MTKTKTKTRGAQRPDKDPARLMNLSRASELCGVSIDALKGAIAREDLETESYEGREGRKFVLVTLGALDRYRRALISKYEAMTSPYYRYLLDQVQGAPMGEVGPPTKARKKTKKAPRRRGGKG